MTRQPGGTPLGASSSASSSSTATTSSARAEALLFAADKAHHVDQLIGPALAAGASSSPTATSTARSPTRAPAASSGADEITALQHWAVGGLLPDLTIVLDVTPEVGRARRGDVHDRLESEADASTPPSAQRLPRACAHGDPDRYLVVDAHAARRRDPRTAAVRRRRRRVQERAVTRLGRPRRSGAHRRDAVARRSRRAAMTHAWLFTGPPGSRPLDRGPRVRRRAPVPRRAAAASAVECRTALDGTHADVKVVATEGLSIKVAEARALVQEAALRPSVGRWRIIIIEDADRLTAYTDAPPTRCSRRSRSRPPRTVWMLCAPSLEDVIVTIRSRSRHVAPAHPAGRGGRRPAPAPRRHRPAMALYAARAAQSHIGLARRLARDEQARDPAPRRHRDGRPRSSASATPSAPPPTSRRSPTRSRAPPAPSATPPSGPGCSRPSAPTRRPAPSRRTSARRSPRWRGSRRPAPPARPATSSTARSSTCRRSTATPSSCGSAPHVDLVNADAWTRCGRSPGCAAPETAAAAHGRDRRGPRPDQRQRAAAARAGSHDDRRDERRPRDWR